MDYGRMSPVTSGDSDVTKKPEAFDMSAMLDAPKKQHISSEVSVDDNINLGNWRRSLEQLSGMHPGRLAEQDTPLGQIVPLEMPPTIASNSSGHLTSLSGTAPSPATPDYAAKHKAIRTEGDHLSKTAIEAVNQAIEKLSQTGDLSSFYDEARAMTSANLENSYGRKIGEQ